MNKRTRRTPQQQIADLQAKIAAIKQRAEQKKAMKDPALKHVAAALRSIDRALSESKDAALRQSLNEARKLLTSGHAPSSGVLIPAAPGARARKPAPSSSQADPKAILRYLSSNPGSRCEDIAAALETDSRSLSPVLKSLKTEGKAKTEGQARGTRYFAAK
jgi:hypothetical protein